MALIQHWKNPEPTFKLLLLRILIYYAALLDALIGILSFSFLHSSFQLWVVEKHMDLYFQYKIKQQEKQK